MSGGGREDRDDGALDSTLASDRPDGASTTAAPEESAVGDVVVRTQPGRLAAGARIGRYVVDRVLGAGGMSVVYAAHDPELARTVAVKLLKASPGGGDLAPRLVREAHALARVVHPHVVVVHDVGTVGGEVFLVQEHLDGGTLGAWQKGDRTWRQILAMYRKAGEGLAAAHAAGLVHRDFKPENVLLGQDGRLRVVDFGLVRIAGEEEPDSTAPEPSSPLHSTLTQTGAVMGTPAYMSPEQHQGSPADPRSDQFAFCVALYEALYREHPFGGASRTEVAARVAAGTVRDPPAGSRVPPWVRRPLLRGLRVSPEERHPSMDALLAELDRDPARRRRRVLVFGGAALAGAALAAIAAGILARSGPSPLEACRAGAPRVGAIWNPERSREIERAFMAVGRPFAADAARGVSTRLDGWSGDHRTEVEDACADTHVRREQSADLLARRMACLERRERELAALVQILAQPDAATVESAVAAAGSLPDPASCGDRQALLAWVGAPPAELAARVQAIRDGLDAAGSLRNLGRLAEAKAKTLPLVDQAKAIGWPAVAAEAWQELGIIHHQLGEEAEAVLALEESVLAAEASRHDEIAAHSHRLIVEALAYQGKTEEAMRRVRTAEAFVARSGGDLDDVAALHRVLTNVHAAAGSYEKALEHARLALAAGEQTRNLEGMRIDRVNLAAALANVGKLDEAGPIMRKILDEAQAAFGAHHPRVADSATNLAKYLYMTGRRDEAAAAFEQAILLYDQLGDTVSASDARTALGRTRNHQGRLDEAERHYLRAIADLEQAAPDSPALQEARSALAGQLGDIGRLDEALAIGEAVVATYRRTKPGHPRLAIALNNLSHVLGLLGRVSDALAAALEAKQILDRIGRTPYESYIYNNLGDAYREAGRLDEAERAYATSIEAGERVMGKDNPWMAIPLTGMGRLLVDRGDSARARPLLERAVALLEKENDENEKAEARFALARALAPTDERAARALAESARDTLRQTKARPRDLARVEAWLERRRRRRITTRARASRRRRLVRSRSPLPPKSVDVGEPKPVGTTRASSPCLRARTVASTNGRGVS